MLILPKKYIDEIDIIELKKRQLRNTKQRKSVEEAYQEYKEKYEHFYSEKAKQYKKIISLMEPIEHQTRIF